MNRLLTTKFVQCWLILLAPVMARAADPLGATPHPTDTTFRVWLPFVDSVSVQVNNDSEVAMDQEMRIEDGGQK